VQLGTSGERQVLLPADTGQRDEEALIMPTADDAKVLRDLIHDADTLYWDTEKEIIIFGKVN
jgi:hypothetical protein